MTSIEWLLEQLEQKGDMRETPSIRNLQLNIDTSDYLELKRQAKEMHKAEIIDAYFEGAYGGDNISGEQYYQETFVSKGSDKHKEKLKELYPDAFSILGEVLYKKCQFEPISNISSSTICANCGREKFLHTN